MQEKNILITGGAGFIGSNFTHYWLKNHKDDNVIVLDALTYAGSLKNLDESKDNKKLNFIKGDICDYELIKKILTERQIDIIVHFAAESHVDRSITGPDEFIRSNITGTHNLLKASLEVWEKGDMQGKLFHHISTDEVYGSLKPDEPPFKETNQYRPNSPYSASKAAADHLVRAYNKTYNLPITVSNCSNNYGSYQFPEKLIPLMIINVLKGIALPVYGDGLNVRDWLYVEDHCLAIDLIIQKGKRGEFYNVGGCNEWKNIDIVKLICSLMDGIFDTDKQLRQIFPDSPMAKGKKAESLISYVKDRLGHDRRYAIDNSKIKNELGFEPLETFKTGIQKTVNWYIKKMSEGFYNI